MADEALDYVATDPALRVVRLDSAETESFLAVKLDTEGRLFVGSRAALFVYEPLPDGKYAPRKELLQFPDHTWVYDVEIRGNDLYLLTVSALYVVPEGRVKRDGLQAHRLVWGVPLGHVHQCFHGMTFGPEGDLYFAMGDPLWYYGDFNRPDHWGHWTMFSRPPGAAPEARDWVKTPYTGVGAVFRCRPDGSDLRVFARGLRNSCGLVFDRDWNLFTNDNDHESMPAEYVPGRLNHVTPHAYFSWPRGWMRSKTPDRADLLDTMIETMGRAVPVGQWYYDDPFLPEKYRHSLLVARWCTRKITFYPLRRQGATFKCDEHELLVGRDQARPVGVTVGRGGRIFATICYMAQNEGSPVYKSDLVMITRADDPDTHPFEPYDATRATPEKLLEEISHAAWSRRYAAHVELTRRGRDVAEDVTQAFYAQRASNKAVLKHLIPLFAASGSAKADGSLCTVYDLSTESMIRLQAVRSFRQSKQSPATSQHANLIEDALDDPDPLVQHAAITALHDEKLEEIPPSIFDGQARSGDAYLRQAATLLIAEQGTLKDVQQLCGSADHAKQRLAGILAAGFRLTLPPATSPLPEKAPLAPWRTEDAYSIQYADAKVDLRTLGRVGLFTVAEHWKGLPHVYEQDALFALLTDGLSDPDEPVRLQAAYFLSLLNDPRSEPRVLQVRTETAKKRLSVAPAVNVTKAWISGPFVDTSGFDTVHPPEREPLDPARVYEQNGRQVAWRETTISRMLNFRETYGPCDGMSFFAAVRLESAAKQPAMFLVGSDDGVKVWQNGSLVWTNDVVRGALPVQDVVLVELQPGSNDFLVRVRNRTGESGLFLHYRSLQPVSATLPEALGANALAARLKEAAADAGNTKVDPKFLETDWTQAAAKGDAENGRKLFGAQGLGCVKCHAATADAALSGGPSLADARKRFTAAYLVESVLLPGKQLSPVFKATVVATKQGKTFTGLVVGETAEKLELLLTDATRTTVPTSDIEERKLQDLSPMPAGLVKTPEELRDLLAYLLGENVRTP